MTPEATTSITRALLMHERRFDISLFIGESVRLPQVEGATLPRTGFEPVVSVGVDELLFNEQPLATLDAGRFDTNTVSNHVVMPLHEMLGEEFAKQRAVDEAKGLPSEPYVIFAIDGRVPYVAMQDLLYTAGRNDVARLGLLVEVGPWMFEPLPLELPRFEMRSDGPDDDGPILMVTIGPEGFAVRDQGEQSRELEPIGPDPARLAARAEQHHAKHPKARVAAVSPDESVDVDTLARAIVALRGPDCRTHVASNCRLPRTVIMAAGSTGYSPRPPPEDMPF